MKALPGLGSYAESFKKTISLGEPWIVRSYLGKKMVFLLFMHYCLKTATQSAGQLQQVQRLLSSRQNRQCLVKVLSFGVSLILFCMIVLIFYFDFLIALYYKLLFITNIDLTCFVCYYFLTTPWTLVVLINSF